MRHAVRSLALLVVVCAVVPLSAQSVPADQQAALFSRILAYDRNLKTRVGSQVTVGIIYKAPNAASRAAGDEMLAAFMPLKQRTIQNLPLDVLAQPYEAGRFDQWLADRKVNVLYVAPGLDAEAADIRGVAAQRKVGLLTSERKLVQQGFTIAVVNKEGKPAIVINLTSARSLGMDLDPKLLQLAEVLH